MKGVIAKIICLLILTVPAYGQSAWGAYPSTNALPDNSWLLFQDWTAGTNTPTNMRRLSFPVFKALVASGFQTGSAVLSNLVANPSLYQQSNSALTTIAAQSTTGTGARVNNNTPTLLHPYIAGDDMVNMNHTHAAAAYGGQLGGSALNSTATYNLGIANVRYGFTSTDATITNDVAVGGDVAVTGGVTASTYSDGTGDLRNDIDAKWTEDFAGTSIGSLGTAGTNSAHIGLRDVTILSLFNRPIIRQVGGDVTFNWSSITGATYVVHGSTNFLTISTVNDPAGDMDVGDGKVRIYNEWTNAMDAPSFPSGWVSTKQIWPQSIPTNSYIDVTFGYLGTNGVWFDWDGPQSTELGIIYGGTGVPTGKAKDALDILGTINFSSVTNAELDLASGTHFRLPNDQNVNLVAPASRISSTLSNTHERMFTFEMLQPASDQIVTCDTNYWTLSGMDQSNNVTSGSVFFGRGANWGPDANQNWLSGNVSTNVAAGGGGTPPGVDYTENLVGAWLCDDASGSITDSSGNGYHLASLGGNVTYQQAGHVEAFSITNGSDTTLVLTNPSPALQLDGSQSFSLGMWHSIGNAADGGQPYIVGRWDSAASERVWTIRLSTGFLWRMGYNDDGAVTSGAFSTTTFAASAGWHYYFVVYDAVANTLGLSVDGVSYQTVDIGDDLEASFTTAFCVGGRLDSGLAADSARGAYEQIALWSDTKLLSFCQGLYNSGAGKPFSEWTP
jgi:hypothetical protein